MYWILSYKNKKTVKYEKCKMEKFCELLRSILVSRGTRQRRHVTLEVMQVKINEFSLQRGEMMSHGRSVPRSE